MTFIEIRWVRVGEGLPRHYYRYLNDPGRAANLVADLVLDIWVVEIRVKREGPV
jgi:hypothetical protein